MHGQPHIRFKEQIVIARYCEAVTFGGGVGVGFILVRNIQGLLFSDSLLSGNVCCMERLLY